MHFINWIIFELGLYIGGLFVIAFFVKLFNYIIFDYYSTGFGRIGSLVMATFMFYKKDELDSEANKTKKVSKLINNVCGYILLSILGLAILILTIMVFI